MCSTPSSADSLPPLLSRFLPISLSLSVSVPLFLTLYLVLFLLVLLLGLSDFRCGSLHVATLSGILGIST